MTEPHASTVVTAAGCFSLVAGATVLGLSVPALVFPGLRVSRRRGGVALNRRRAIVVVHADERKPT